MHVWSRFSCVWLLATPWDVARQASLSMGSLQARILTTPFPTRGDLPDTGIQSASPALQAESLPLSHRGSPLKPYCHSAKKIFNSKSHFTTPSFPALQVIHWLIMLFYHENVKEEKKKVITLHLVKVQKLMFLCNCSFGNKSINKTFACVWTSLHWVTSINSVEFSSDLCKWPNENMFFPRPTPSFLCLRIPASLQDPTASALRAHVAAPGVWGPHRPAPRPPGPQAQPLASRTETGAQETLTRFRRKAGTTD